MEKVKVFYSRDNSKLLENKINEFLNTNKVEITRVMQSATGRLDHHVTITIFYKEIK